MGSKRKTQEELQGVLSIGSSRYQRGHLSASKDRKNTEFCCNLPTANCDARQTSQKTVEKMTGYKCGRRKGKYG